MKKKYNNDDKGAKNLGIENDVGLLFTQKMSTKLIVPTL